jgi:hypothetical protein
MHKFPENYGFEGRKKNVRRAGVSKKKAKGRGGGLRMKNYNYEISKASIHPLENRFYIIP